MEEFPAAISQGETIEEAKVNLADALKLLLQCQPEVLRAIGEESRRKGTASLSSQQIDRIIQAARAKRLGPKTKR